MKHSGWTMGLLAVLALAGCGGSGGGGRGGKPSGALHGVVQKGPFVEGSTVEIHELDAQLNRTRRVVTARTNALGEYSVEADFSGPVEVIATGRFFDELTGSVSSSDARLLALADASASRQVNVNVLSDLVYERARHLAKDGQTLERASQTAKDEVLRAFHVDPATAPGRATNLELLQAGSGGAALLAVSSYVLQVAHDRVTPSGTGGTDVSAKLSGVLNDFGLDLVPTGTVEDPTLTAELRTAAGRVAPTLIVANLSARLRELGSTGTPPDIGSVVDADWDGVADAKANEVVYSTGNLLTSPAVNDAGDVAWVESTGTHWSVVKKTSAETTTVRSSAAEIESVSLNDLGEVVWSERVGGHVQLFSNQRGQLTAGVAENHSPSLNDRGELVWATQTCEGAVCAPMSVVSSLSGTVASGSGGSYRPSLDDEGEIVWDELVGSSWRIVSNRRGVLREFPGGCVQGAEPALSGAGVLLWVELDLCSPPPYERRLMSSLSDVPLFRDTQSLPAPSVNHAGRLVFVAREGGTYKVLERQLP